MPEPRLFFLSLAPRSVQGYWSDRMTDEILAAQGTPVPASESPLTCGACRNSPATHLVVADIGGQKPVRAQQLNCKACADFARGCVRPGDHVYLYRLVPEEANDA